MKVRQRTDQATGYLHTVVLYNWEFQMLETIAILLLILWALGMVSSYTMGGFIHALLVIAVVVVLVRVIRGRGAL